MPGIRLFLSAVTAEFGEDRDIVRRTLAGPRVEVKIQEDFREVGLPTLLMLDEYISSCDGIIHIAGREFGTIPPKPSVDALLQKYPDLISCIPEHETVMEAIWSYFSYTQWEAYLAIYHRKRLYVFRSTSDIQNNASTETYRPDFGENDKQELHIQRLAKLDFHPTPFINRHDLMTGIALALLNVYIRAGVTPPIPAQQLHSIHSLAPPIVPQYTKRAAAERELIGLLERCALNGAGAISLEGIGGSGKTTLAAIVVADARIVRMFPGGIVWLTIGRDRIDERLSSYICDVVQLLTGTHFAAKDFDLSAAALIDSLATRLDPILLVLDDVWTDAQVAPFLRGGTNVTRLAVSRNRLGSLKKASSIEIHMMSRDEAIKTLLDDLPNGIHEAIGADLLNDLLTFSHSWPVLLSIINAALCENISSGAVLDDVAAWLIHLIQERGPTALDGAATISLEKSIEVTLNVTLDLIDGDTRDMYSSLIVFDEDELIPESIIHLYWRKRFDIPIESSARILSRLAHLRLLTPRWVNRLRGFVLHDVFRDFFIHRATEQERVAMSLHLVESWRASYLSEENRSCWYHLPPSASFIFENLIGQLTGAGCYQERTELLHDLRWHIAQIMSLGSAATSIADLDDLKDPTSFELKSYLSKIAMLLRRESTGGILASTLLAYIPEACRPAGLPKLASRFQEATDWPTLCAKRQLNIPAFEAVKGHFGPIGDIAESYDGRLIATASDDGIALILSANDGSIKWRLRGHSERVRSCAFSPDSACLLTSGMDGTARLWDVLSGECIAVLGREGVALLGSCWSPSGNLVAGSFADGRTLIWNVMEGKVIADAATERHGGGAWDCKFINESEIVTVGENGYVRHWRFSDWCCHAEIKVHSEKIRRCEVSADRAYVLTASSDRTAALIDLSTRTVLGYLRGHLDRLRSATFARDGKCIVTAAEDKTVRVWDAKTLAQMSSMQDHADWVGKAIFYGDGKSILSCSGDASVLRWHPENASLGGYKAEPILTRDGDDTSSCCFSPDGNTVFYGKVNGVRAVTLQGELIAELGGHSGRVFDVAVDGEFIYSAGADGKIISYDIYSYNLHSMYEAGSRIWSICVLEKMGLLISVAEDGFLRVHEPRSLRVIHQSIQRRGHLMSCASNTRHGEIGFVGDGSYFNKISITSGDYSEHELPLSAFRSLWTCAFSNDGQHSAVAGEPGNQVIILNAAGRPDKVLHTSAGRITSVAFNCDDRFVATCGDDACISIWDTEAGTPLTGLRTQFPLRRCEWSPINPHLLVAAGTGGEYLLEVRAR